MPRPQTTPNAQELNLKSYYYETAKIKVEREHVDFMTIDLLFWNCSFFELAAKEFH